MFHRCLILALFFNTTAFAAERFAIIMAMHDAKGRLTLKYPTRDAKDFYSIMKEMGGLKDVKLLINPKLSQVKQTFKELSKEIKKYDSRV